MLMVKDDLLSWGKRGGGEEEKGGDSKKKKNQLLRFLLFLIMEVKGGGELEEMGIGTKDECPTTAYVKKKIKKKNNKLVEKSMYLPLIYVCLIKTR